MNDFEIIGKGNVGEKGRELMNKTPYLKEIGFYVPQRTILAEGFWDDFCQENLDSKNLEEFEKKYSWAEIFTDSEIRSFGLTQSQINILHKITNKKPNWPFAIRSSAEGDARGTGIYDTKFETWNSGEFQESVRDVFASYFSESAQKFREDSKSGRGFGIIVEPLIGQEVGYRDISKIAPIISGFGYTSTSQGEGFVNVVPGMCGGVETRNGEKISLKNLKKSGGNFLLYWGLERIKAIDNERKNSALLGDKFNYPFESFFDGIAYSVSDKRVTEETLRFTKDKFEFNLVDYLFEPMRKMEEEFGPQYFEWCMTNENETPKFWITQVANYNKKTDEGVDFGGLEDIIFIGNQVIGTGERICNKIAFCWNPEDINALNEFNRFNKNYVLLFSSRCTSMGSFGQKLSYHNFSNASAFLEIQDEYHSRDAIDHLGGQLDMTNKFFGVLNYNSEISTEIQFAKFKTKSKREFEDWENGIEVYQGNVKVIASELQDRMVIKSLE